MVKFILGAKGAGKTKWLIDNANKDMKEGNGNIAFVDVDDNHIFSLNYNVRLINANEYNIDNLDSFYGFLCGLLGMDYDLEKIYVDGIYKVINLGIEDIKNLHEKLNSIAEKTNTDFYINVDFVADELPEELQKVSEEVVAE